MQNSGSERGELELNRNSTLCNLPDMKLFLKRIQEKNRGENESYNISSLLCISPSSETNNRKNRNHKTTEGRTRVIISPPTCESPRH